MKLLLPTLTAIFCLGFTTLHGQETPDLDRLTDWFTGDFSPEKTNGDASCEGTHMHVARIWPDRPNGAWLYVEYDRGGTSESPPLEWVYFVSTLGESQFSCDTYQLPDPDSLGSTRKSPEYFKDKTPFDLKYQDGCTLFLTYDGFQYDGTTNRGTCPLSSGTGYAMATLNLTPKAIRWGMGRFDRDNKPISGSGINPCTLKSAKW